MTRQISNPGQPAPPETHLATQPLGVILEGPLVVDAEGEDDAPPGLDAEPFVQTHQLLAIVRSSKPSS